MLTQGSMKYLAFLGRVHALAVVHPYREHLRLPRIIAQHIDVPLGQDEAQFMRVADISRTCLCKRMSADTVLVVP